MLRLSLLLFFVLNTHAMKKENDNSDFLVKLPRNASNRIAHFLGWETKEAFLQRTCDDIKDRKRILYNNVVSVDKTKQAIFCNFTEKRHSKLDVYHMQDNGNQHAIFNMLFDAGYRFTRLAFNQQGTILLARYDYLSRKKLRLFKLNAIVDYETKKSGLEKKEENALQEYLRHHLVCKKII
jgi:hypothetical protein